MEGHYSDAVLRCRDCETDFVWTAGEQTFYASKGLVNRPARCPSCRVAARQAREAGASSGRSREFFPAVCDRCGIQTQVPFLPRSDRPVYCSACFETVRSAAQSG
jgi:CxxC-x17-CxxC domain-containing protein